MADTQSRSGTTYSRPEVLRWVDALHAPHDGPLGRAFGSPQVENMPAIQVGVSEGKLLELFVRLVGAKRVVEVGTLAGYSTIRLGRAMDASGVLHTIEADPKHAEVARKNLEQAKLAPRWQVHVGKGATVLPTLEPDGPFDLVFIDADKDSYDLYCRWAVANLRPGGLLLADNAYLFGELLEQAPRGEAMRRAHEETAKHCDSVCIPTPDGLLLGIKR